MASMGKLLPKSVWDQLRNLSKGSKGSYQLKPDQTKRILKIHKGIHNAILHQYNKFGEQNHDADRWMVILMEEVGEVARAIYEGQVHEAKKELYQVAAVAAAAIEQILREQAAAQEAVPVTKVPIKEKHNRIPARKKDEQIKKEEPLSGDSGRLRQGGQDHSTAQAQVEKQTKTQTGD